jgi:branched-chain amino acid transport system ATP-binding protein/urea transport system ATP-binding protein
MLCGLLRPSGGDIILRGEKITGAEPHEIARRGVGIKTQVPSLFDGMTVRQSIELSALRRQTNRTARKSAMRLMESLTLDKLDNSVVGSLAHGQRQWVELAMVLATDPELVLLDEPTAGMAKDEVERMAGLIREINRDHTLIIVEHDMNFIRMIARKVTVFNRGSILAEGHIESILANQKVRDVYLGKGRDRA